MGMFKQSPSQTRTEALDPGCRVKVDKEIALSTYKESEVQMLKNNRLA